MYVMHKIACNCSHTYTRLYEYILTILHVVKVFSPNGSCMYPLCITLAFMSFSAVFQLSSARCTTPLSRHVSFHFASFATHICIHQVCALHAYTHTHTNIVYRILTGKYYQKVLLSKMNEYIQSKRDNFCGNYKLMNCRDWSLIEVLPNEHVYL